VKVPNLIDLLLFKKNILNRSFKEIQNAATNSDDEIFFSLILPKTEILIRYTRSMLIVILTFKKKLFELNFR